MRLWLTSPLPASGHHKDLWGFLTGMGSSEPTWNYVSQNDLVLGMPLEFSLQWPNWPPCKTRIQPRKRT